VKFPLENRECSINAAKTEINKMYREDDDYRELIYECLYKVYLDTNGIYALTWFL